MQHPVKEMTITIGAPRSIAGHAEGGREVLAAFYGELLGMQVIDTGWMRIAKSRDTALRIALDSDGWSDERPPAWGDLEHPQQMHLDVEVLDLAWAGDLVTKLGATLLADGGDHRVYGDPAGHPFCLYAAPVDAPVVRRLVFDCYSPRSLATFYEGLLGVDPGARAGDTPERVVIALGDDRFPDFAFQHAEFVASRWPDPAYPAQMHVDYRFADGTDAAVERAEGLGAVRLPKLADTEIFADPAAHPFCL